ncbi:helix-turn-helix domain-containing protein [Pseudonocardia sp. RS010]|uniref:helix-turn-helix domain-containing protein n=1 Tax=Pseudonocardia sp. RS010 TaxID=3385979 RepID=UPI0039A29069
MPARPDLLLHPVRMRVVRALLGGRRCTTGQLRDELSDVPVATLYRQVARLVEGGALEIVDEHRVRGSVERTYALRDGVVDVGPEEAARMTPESAKQALTAFLAALAAGYERFLDTLPDSPEALAREVHGFRTAAFWLTEAELAALTEDLRAALAPYRACGEGGGRRRVHLATVLFPDPPCVAAPT